MTALTLNLRTSRAFLGRQVAAFYVAVLVASLPVWPFAWHLGLHVIGATALIGNALVMAVWLTIAGFSQGDAAKRRAIRTVILGDVWFTVPGVVLLFLNGLAMVGIRYGGLPAFTTTSWITAGVLLLGSTGLIWVARLVPAQLALYRLAHTPGPIDDRAFRAVLMRWSFWGVIATILPLLAVVVMTTKPTF
jgi:uncharacterized membrane protein